MANTTNFGWETPDDTDLVKDGAAAMRTLGNAIDASLVDLKGGTTNQVLAKNSNTDMDFKWVETDDTNAIQNAIVDAKGDLIAASAADTPARLAVGNNGDTLVADSSTTTGLRWQATPSASNPFINSAMDIWQRGTSITVSTNTYAADRWFVYRAAAGCTASRQVTGDTTNLPNIQYALRVQRDSGNTSTTVIAAAYNFESVDSIPFAGKTVTVSAYVRRGANFSQSGNTLLLRLFSGTGTDQNVVLGFTGATEIGSVNPTLTTTWQRVSFTATVGTAATQLGLYVGVFTPSGTAGANDWFEITGVQMDVGSVALPFRRQANTLAGEFQACARYYYRTAGQGNYAPTGISGVGQSTTTANGFFLNPVAMRTNATAIEFSNIAFYDGTNVTALTNMTLDDAGITSQRVGMNAAAGLTQYRPGFAVRNNNAAGYVAFSAEL